MDHTLNWQLPQIGAEIFIEPGQTAAEIDGWFSQLRDCGMTVTRIRMFESYMHLADGTWDFSLFDAAFIAGEKYGIAIYANLFPATIFTDVGGFKFANSEENLESIANYIAHLVTHFRKFPALYGWVPINEPGSGKLPEDEFTSNAFGKWKEQELEREYNSNGFTTLDFAEERFLLDHNTWFLKWLTDQILRHDPGAIIHVNNHAIFQHAAEYDFPAWRKFLTSLGGSAHASWHFGYFSRSEYAVAMSANSEILRSGAGEIPWLMTELQGGNNTYSAFEPMCPTDQEIAQWLWITIGSGSKGSIFWCLNPRRSGFEAGEWAMLDFLDQPTTRMLTAKKVIDVLNKNTKVFTNSSVLESKIDVIYTRESMWVEKVLQIPGAVNEGRSVGGVMKSALSYFEALSELGVHVGFKELREFDFTASDYTGHALILSHQISIPSSHWSALHSFVEKGGKLLVDGLTGYYDERAVTLMGKGFPFQDLFGATVREFKMVDKQFPFNLNDHAINLSATLWRASLKITTGRSVASTGDEINGVRNRYGRGEVLYLPALIGLAARVEGSYAQLLQFLSIELETILSQTPFVFKTHHPKVLIKVLSSGDDRITVLINKSNEVQEIELTADRYSGTFIYTDGAGTLYGNLVKINPEETLVIKWSLPG